MPVEFTKEQQRVIDVRDRDVLVSAAAGSGKTSVLVERIIQMILSKEDPVDIDRLLVVTFTEAAAAQMKEKIAEAIDQKLYLDPENEHLQKQSALLYKAQISTIHSFCLNVIRNNFNRIGLDPSFRVADDSELKLLSEEVITGLFEDKYRDNDESFLNCVETYSPGTSDDALKDNVLKIAEFAEGYPWPLEWIKDCISQYKITDVTDVSSSLWAEYVYKHIKAVLEDITGMISHALDLIHAPGGPVEYEGVFLGDLDTVNELIRSKDLNGLRESFQDISFGRIPGKVSKDVDELLKNKVKAIREKYKKILAGKSRTDIPSLLERSPEDEAKILKASSGSVITLLDLTAEYLKAFKERKQEKGIISFSDMEHYAIDILYDEGPKGHVPSDVAFEIRDGFKEILMDEYQDCNRVQELIISSVSFNGPDRFNRFMVGDVKQSIYKFRLASPELFIEKYMRYESHDQSGRDDIEHERIDLHKNFRSRKSVINTVNDLFSQIMKAPVGGVEYDAGAYLVPGMDYPDIKTQDIVSGDPMTDESEILLLTTDEDPDEGSDDITDTGKGEKEAYLIAHRIKELMRSYMVTDDDGKSLRPVRYRDIVILLRSMTDVASGIKTVFTQEGIPFYMNVNTGFYNTREIQTIIQYLKVIDNPRHEIPLYGTLTSFFGGFTDEEIARIRDVKYGEELIDQLRFFRDKDPKINDFLTRLDELRKMSAYTGISGIITCLVYETGYMEHVTASPGGEQRSANLKLLINKASSYENTNYRGLNHFIRYVGQLKKTMTDEGEADVSDENADLVRVMTIHKSKGLEFPVCFVSGIHKKFNTEDIKGSLICDMDLGVGTSYIDPDRRIKTEPLYKKAISLKLKNDLIGEELRVLYVAMTRAKEKLILTGLIKDGDPARDDTGITFTDIAGAGSFLDLLSPLLKDAKICDMNTIMEATGSDRKHEADSRAQFLKEILSGTPDEQRCAAVKARMERRYAHEDLFGLIRKTSVSELKKAYLDLEDTKELFPSHELMEDTDTEDGRKVGGQSAKTKISGTDRGSAYHKVMELLDLNDRDIKSQINKFVESEMISREWADAVSVDKIERFMETDMSRRMADAQKKGNLKKEQPFVLGISADRVDASFPDSETILLQGIIDVFFEEEDGIVLLDYKTDVIKSGKELKHRYHIQLDYYAEAIERILGIKVKEKVLYSFCLNEVIGLD